MADDEEDGWYEVAGCPSCGGEDCEHWLVTIDLTFGTVVGGPLASWCTGRLSVLEVLEDSGQIPSALDALIDEMEALPNVAVLHYEEDCGRGECLVAVNAWADADSSAVAVVRQLEAL